MVDYLESSPYRGPAGLVISTAICPTLSVSVSEGSNRVSESSDVTLDGLSKFPLKDLSTQLLALPIIGSFGI